MKKWKERTRTPVLEDENQMVPLYLKHMNMLAEKTQKNILEDAAKYG